MDDLEPEATYPSISLALLHYSKISIFSDSNVNSLLKYGKDSSKPVEELRIKGSNDFDFLIPKLNKGDHKVSTVTWASLGILTICGPGQHLGVATV